MGIWRSIAARFSLDDFRDSYTVDVLREPQSYSGKLEAEAGAQLRVATMEYWLQLTETLPEQIGVWQFDGKTARQINVMDFSGLNVIQLGERGSILQAFKKERPASRFHQLKLSPGEYYPHMARPTSEDPKDSPGRNPDPHPDQRERANSAGQMVALIEQLEAICRVVHPEGVNMRVFGQGIRNVLILACTEVEAHCRRILSANGNEGTNMTEYARLAGAMRLGEYSVSFPYYPWLKPIRPFNNWKLGRRLGWYSAYNGVKHNREKELSRGTLQQAFQAVAGCFVLLCAEKGWDFALKGKAANRAFLKLIGVPNWHPSELYVIPYQTEWHRIEHPLVTEKRVRQR